MFSPKMGTWMQRDPAEDGLDLYQYGDSNPTNRLDPFGLADGPATQPSTQPVDQANPGKALLLNGGFKPYPGGMYQDTWAGKKVITKYQGWSVAEEYKDADQASLWSGSADKAPNSTTIPPKLAIALEAARLEAAKDGFEWGGVSSIVSAKKAVVFAPISTGEAGSVPFHLALAHLLLLNDYGGYHIHPMGTNGQDGLNLSPADIKSFMKGNAFSLLTDNAGQEVTVLIRLSTAKKLPQPSNYVWGSDVLIGLRDARKEVAALIGKRNWKDIPDNEKPKLLSRLTAPFDKVLCRTGSEAGWALYRGYFGGPLNLVDLAVTSKPATATQPATSPA